MQQAIAWLAAVHSRADYGRAVAHGGQWWRGVAFPMTHTGPRYPSNQVSGEQRIYPRPWATHDVLTMWKITKFDMQFISSVSTSTSRLPSTPPSHPLSHSHELVWPFRQCGRNTSLVSTVCWYLAKSLSAACNKSRNSNKRRTKILCFNAIWPRRREEPAPACYLQLSVAWAKQFLPPNTLWSMQRGYAQVNKQCLIIKFKFEGHLLMLVINELTSILPNYRVYDDAYSLFFCCDAISLHGKNSIPLLSSWSEIRLFSLCFRSN